MSTINASTEKSFLNAWIPVLRSMLDILKIRKNTKKENILSELYKQNEDMDDKIFILERIFGLELPKKHDQIEITEGPNHFIEREVYNEEITEYVVDFLADFIQKDVLKDSEEQSLNANHSLEVPPIIIFFDDVYMMDKPSWQLLGKLSY